MSLLFNFEKVFSQTNCNLLKHTTWIFYQKKENKRTPLKIEGIKIVDKTSIPVVIVECGFLSNAEEANLLNDDSYQRKIVDGIVNGIEEYYQ